MISETNGCGACSGFWKWFKPPHTNFFKEECDQHDIDYYNGGGYTERLIADIKLNTRMKIKVLEYFKGRKPLSKYWYLFICYFYYIGLRLVGWSNFNYKKE